MHKWMSERASEWMNGWKNKSIKTKNKLAIKWLNSHFEDSKSILLIYLIMDVMKVSLLSW